MTEITKPYLDGQLLESERSNSGGAFLAGLGVAGGIALLHNAERNQRHQTELQQEYQQGCWDTRWKMQQTVLAKDLEIAALKSRLAQHDIQLEKKDGQIAQLSATVENLSATMRAQELQLTAKIFPHDNNDDFGNSESN